LSCDYRTDIRLISYAPFLTTPNITLYHPNILLTPHYIALDDDDLFDSEEEEEISKRVLDEAGGPPEGSGKVGRATRKVRGWVRV